VIFTIIATLVWMNRVANGAKIRKHVQPLNMVLHVLLHIHVPITAILQEVVEPVFQEKVVDGVVLLIFVWIFSLLLAEFKHAILHQLILLTNVALMEVLLLEECSW